MNVVEVGTAGVGGVGDMHPAAGEAPDQETVHGAEAQFARMPRDHARAIHTIQNPRKLGAGEIGSRSRPVFAVTISSWPAFFITAQISAVRLSCQTMAL